MTSKIYSSAVIGLDCQTVLAEVDLSVGLHTFAIVGLPDKAVEESKERINAAIKNSGFSPPYLTNRRVIVNLAPADLKKQGPAYDLPIALSFLLASDQLLPADFNFNKSLFVGELSLEGELRHINGILPIALSAKAHGFENLFVPKVNGKEAALVVGLNVYGVNTLNELSGHLQGLGQISKTPTVDVSSFYQQGLYACDFAYVKGQEHAKRALEIAASGAHNVLLSGPPGSGKTLLARSLPSILPPLSLDDALEVTKIFSVAGLLRQDEVLITQRPFRSPHHSASSAALVGGGTYPRPGEITLAHRGVLFLDEFPEFSRHVLESLRQPLEDGVVTVSRAATSLTFPARFVLVAAMNPCPCGQLTNPWQQCICTPRQVANYKHKISGPLLDRIDLCVEVPHVKYDKLTSEQVAESSATVRTRVLAARQTQERRFQNNKKIRTNAEMGLQELKQFCRLDVPSANLLRQAVNQMHLSARGYHRVLKISRTIADLAGLLNIQSSHIAEALQYRPKLED
ncbi:MAG: magnesium chelatase [Candidatus Portnoybacteria bacterium CG06_land_8_20_14_3_00_39_12]|uniref:Magnesium chelatase n=2 Tax=Candidatus Portnoyibacteriota TaxID=1817913 RepID=A0A2M8KFT7_9BACT|nr:MAG: magnesium chelatase [Candidatus Portnoybacteria bacterium CG06_land_8_20_14_3_00_39_12]PJE58779.1 MAG: magnesium chelatase [Candidatus Portnoybacteria bacterium CG10_big_fil_rev_8_21_14_0_10_40_22]